MKEAVGFFQHYDQRNAIAILQALLVELRQRLDAQYSGTKTPCYHFRTLNALPILTIGVDPQ